MRFVTALLFTLLFSRFMAAQAAGSVTQAPVVPDPATRVSGTTQANGSVAAVRAVLILRTSLSSKSASAGKEVKATLKQAVTLPNGIALPKGSTFMGSVVAVSKHSKEKPNGAFVVTFDHLVMKGGDPMPVIVRLTSLADSEDNGEATTLPNSNGNMVSLAGNSGGSSQIVADMNDRSSLKGKYKPTSTIPGVYLSATTQGSGAVFAGNDDVYLDPDIQMSALIAVPPPAK